MGFYLLPRAFCINRKGSPQAINYVSQFLGPHEDLFQQPEIIKYILVFLRLEGETENLLTERCFAVKALPS